MFRLNARGRQAVRLTSIPAVAAFPSGQTAPAVRSVVALVPTAEPLRVAPNAVRKLLRAGNLPAALVVTDPLRMLNESWLRKLPTSLECTHLDVSCTTLNALPERLRATSVHAARTAGREIPGGWLVREYLDLSANPHLTSLPERFTARSLDVSTCPRLLNLPANLHLTHWLELAGSGLISLPVGLRV